MLQLLLLLMMTVMTIAITYYNTSHSSLPSIRSLSSLSSFSVPLSFPRQSGPSHPAKRFGGALLTHPPGKMTFAANSHVPWALFTPRCIQNAFSSADHRSSCWYEGRSINKLQNGIILLIFKIWKIRNTVFVCNLTGHKYWNFYWRWRHYCDVTCT